MLRALDVLVVPGKFLVGMVAQIKKRQQEQCRRKVTERQLAHLHHKIDKLLVRLEENEPEPALSQEEECAICISAKATMQTFPCGHRVVCRKCFVKTIQMAVSQRLLPLRCVICRTKILRLKQTPAAGTTLLGVKQQATRCHHPTSTEAMPRSLSSSTSRLPLLHRQKGGQAAEASVDSGDVVLLLPRSQQQSSIRRRRKRSLGPPSTSDRRRFGSKASCLLPIPELEELKLEVESAGGERLPDFGREVWSMQEELDSSAAEADRHHFVKWWWARVRVGLRPPSSLLAAIKNKWKPLRHRC